jgi:hypothetical protein
VPSVVVGTCAALGKFAGTGAVGLEMLLLHAGPGTRTADAMAALAARVPA